LKSLDLLRMALTCFNLPKRFNAYQSSEKPVLATISATAIKALWRFLTSYDPVRGAMRHLDRFSGLEVFSSLPEVASTLFRKYYCEIKAVIESQQLPPNGQTSRLCRV
jgi:hypothetical protein